MTLDIAIIQVGDVVKAPSGEVATVQEVDEDANELLLHIPLSLVAPFTISADEPGLELVEAR